MTADFLEWGPCLVPPTAWAAPPPPPNATQSLPPTATQSVPPRQKVCRNLFGAPMPGEAEALRREEELRSRKRLKDRFGVSLVNGTPTPSKKTKLTSATATKIDTTETTPPSLIEIELQAHAKRLQALDDVAGVDDDDDVEQTETCNLKIEVVQQAILEKTPQQPKRQEL